MFYILYKQLYICIIKEKEINTRESKSSVHGKVWTEDREDNYNKNNCIYKNNMT